MKGLDFGRHKPHIGSRIDWANPITRNLWCNYNFTNSGPAAYDSCGRAGTMAFVGSPAPVWSSQGLTVGNGKGYVRNNKTVISTYNPVIGDVTIRVVHIPRTWPGGYTCFLDGVGTATGSGRILNLFADTSGILIYRGIGGSDGNATVGTLTMPTGVVNDVVWVRRMGIGGVYSTHDWYLNGKHVFTEPGFAGTANLWPTDGHDISCGGNPSGGGTLYDGQYLKFQLWSRALSPNEILNLYANPYAEMLAKPNFRQAGMLLEAPVIDIDPGGEGDTSTTIDVVKTIPVNASSSSRNGRAVFLMSRKTIGVVRTGFQQTTQTNLESRYTNRFDDTNYYTAGR